MGTESLRRAVRRRSAGPRLAAQCDSHLAGRASPAALRALPVRRNEVGDARRDLAAEARAVEHAVVPDAELKVMGLALGRNAGAQPVRRFGLADAGNVVLL